MSNLVFAKNVKANGSNLQTFLKPSDLNRDCQYEPQFYDAFAPARFSEGRMKIEFTKEEFISEVATFVGLVKPNWTDSSCLKKAEICFSWWYARGAIVDVQEMKEAA